MATKRKIAPKGADELKIALLTSCSVSRNYQPELRIQDAPIFSTMSDLCDWWADSMHLMRKVNPGCLKTPGELYKGVSFDTVTEMAQDIGHENIYIVTGGAGLSRHTDKLVPYDFTSDKGADHNARPHVTGEKFMPHVWWQMVNSRLHSKQFPVAALLEKYDIIVGALPKNFAKYIFEDLAQLPGDVLGTRVFIPVPRSMLGSIPPGVRAAFVPYSNAYASDVMSSRYNKPQKVVQKFLRSCTTIESAQAAADTIREESASIGMANGRPQDALDYETMFKAHPEVLEAPNAVMAARTVKMLGLKIGGKHRFEGAWLGAKGPQESEFTKKDVVQARGHLREVLAHMKTHAASSNDEILERIGLFVAALREEGPDITFTSKEVVEWCKLAYKQDADENPAVVGAKVASLLKSHTAYLGLKDVTIGSTLAYRLA